MERLAKEYLGEFGAFWQKDAERQLEKFLDNLETGRMIIDENGSLRWKTGNAVPVDIAELLFVSGNIKEKTVRSTEIANDEELKAAMKRMKNRRMTNEEKFEIEANFDKGTKMINVLTGETFTV